MKRRYTERDLYVWGDSLYRLQEFAEETGDSLIQKMVDYHCVVGGDFSAEHMAVPEFPPWIRLINQQAAKLDRQQRRAVSAFYSAQLVDGMQPTKRQVAIGIGMNFNKFREHLSRGKKRLLNLLNF